MFPRYPHNPNPDDDDWTDQPAQSAFHKWALGVLLPLGLLAFGIYTIVVQQTQFGRTGTAMTLRGANAAALGVAAISLAVFLHCHYFWGNLYSDAWLAVLGKILAACGFIAGMGTLIVRVGVLGIR